MDCLMYKNVITRNTAFSVLYQYCGFGSLFENGTDPVHLYRYQVSDFLISEILTFFLKDGNKIMFRI
jgi:hypothetical protein